MIDERRRGSRTGKSIILVLLIAEAGCSARPQGAAKQALLPAKRQIEACLRRETPATPESSGPFRVQVPSAVAFCRGSADLEECRRIRLYEVRQAVPALDAADQFLDEYDFYQAYPEGPVPDLVELRFRPRAIGPHLALTRVLTCEQYDSYMMCTFHSERAIFDTDLDAAFAAEGDISIDTGLALARAYSTMRIQEGENACIHLGIKRCRPPIRAVHRCGDRFVMDVRSRECEASLLVTVSRMAWWSTVQLVETPFADNGPGLCCDVSDLQCKAYP